MGKRRGIFLVTLVNLCHLFFISGASGDSPDLKGPPHLTGEMISVINAKIGDTVKIDCPIDSDSTLPIFYDWKKDGETITSGWDRFRVTTKKLRIRGILGEDGGLFTCKGTNGFGSMELSTRLIVHDENGNIVSGTGDEDEEEKKESEFSGGLNLDDNLFESHEVSGSRPTFSQISSPPHGSVFRPTVGSSLSLICRAQGEPTPIVTWTKQNHHDNNDRNGENMKELLHTGQKFELYRIKVEDSGVYICSAHSPYGTINASFIVQVIEAELDEDPSIISLEPSSLTAARGQLIHFRCLINSKTVPIVQWLRELDDEEENDPKALLIGGVRYRVVSSGSRVHSLLNGTYVNEISVHVEGKSSGFLCLATSHGGAFKFKRTSVTIIDRGSSNELMLPLGILIAIPVTVICLLSALTLLICCFRRTSTPSHQSNNIGQISRATTTTYATPRDAMTQSPHHKNNEMTTNSYPHAHFHHASNKNNSNYNYNGTKMSYEAPTSPAYASVPICESILGGQNFPPLPRGPPLPTRPNFNAARNSFNQNGLTQPLLTQTGSSSDSRESRTSGGFRNQFHSQGDGTNNSNVKQSEWGLSSGGSEASSWDKKTNNRSQHQHHPHPHLRL